MLSPTARFISQQIKAAIEVQFFAERFDQWRGVTPVVAAKPRDRVWAKLTSAQPARRVRSVEGDTGSDVLGMVVQDLVITLDTFWFPERVDVQVRDWFLDVSLEDDGSRSNSYGQWYTARGNPKFFSDFGVTAAGHQEIVASGSIPPAALALAYVAAPLPEIGEEMPSTALYTGTLTVTTVAAPLTLDRSCMEVLVQADPDNTVDVFVGNSSAQPIQLLPGASTPLTVANVNLVWARTVAGTALMNWVARN